MTMKDWKKESVSLKEKNHLIMFSHKSGKKRLFIEKINTGIWRVSLNKAIKSGWDNVFLHRTPSRTDSLKFAKNYMKLHKVV